jgi:hypothetical protein
MRKKISCCIMMVLCSFYTIGQDVTGVYPNLDIRSFMSLNVELNNTNTLFDFNTVDKLNNGITQTGMFKVEVKSNKNWIVLVSSTSEFLEPEDPVWDDKIPSSVFRLRKTGQANWRSLGTTQCQIANGNRGGKNRQGNTFMVDLNASPGLSFMGGTYSCDIIFTITPD